MREYFIAGNWKMNGSDSMLSEFRQELHSQFSDLHVVSVAVFPPTIYLKTAVEIFRGSAIAVGSQNCHWELSGAFTGENSARFVRAVGGTYSIVGHSEVRRDGADTDHRVGRRASAAIEAGITPIICVGESLAERQSGKTNEIVKAQIDAIISASTKPLSTAMIAYEPIWAIGTGLAASPDQVEEVHTVIKEQLGKHGLRLRVLYGGSVTSANADELFGCDSVDGALVGGASLTLSEFTSIITSAINRATH